jgi:hypothetical protein
MSEKISKEDDEVKEGEIDAAILDDAFDDHHGFGDEDQDDLLLPKDAADEDDPTPEWRSDDQPDNW